jgi:cytochrome c553
MIARGVLLLSAGLMLVTSPVHAGDVSAGKEKSERCATCHGEDGKEDPVLAGMDEAQFIQKLKAFKSGEGNNKKMMKIAASLSDEDMADLAAYYASLK